MSSVPNAHKIYAQLSGPGGESKFANGDAINDSLSDYDIGGSNDTWGKSGLTMDDISSLSIDVWVQASHATQDVDKEIDSVSVKIFYQAPGGAIFATSMNIGPSVGL
jgi:hypothetical protein